MPTGHVQLPRAQQPAPNDPPGIRVAVWKVDGLGAKRQWRRWGPSLWTPAEAAGTAPTAEAGGGQHGATARGERTTVAQPRGGTALLGRWSNASWTMQVVEQTDRHGGAHVIDNAMNPWHLRGQGSGSGKQLMHPSYGAVPQPDAAATTITAAMDPEGTATAGTGDDGQVPFHCRIVHIVDGEPAGGHGGPRNRAHQRWEAATIVQQLRHVLTTGTTRDDRQRLEAVLREADLADVMDPEGYGSRPGAAPRLERFPMLGRPTQHVANAATAAATTPDDPWHCPTTPYTECGPTHPTHRARGTCLWTEQGNVVEEHRVLQTPFGPHLMHTLVIRPEPGRWAALAAETAHPRQRAWRAAAHLPTREAAGDEGTEADSDNGGKAREQQRTGAARPSRNHHRAPPGNTYHLGSVVAGHEGRRRLSLS
ncbi:UNVERIFIED_CONTAM: hypothetical protein K2H54_038107 [Gekko kuhli]